MKHLVKRIYEFFSQNPGKDGKDSTIYDFIQTLSDGVYKDAHGITRINMSFANYVSKISKQMENDCLMIKVQGQTATCLFDVYYVNGVGCIGDFPSILEEMDYGTFDFKYNDFVYTRGWFEKSVVSIVGTDSKGDEGIGTAYYIGNRVFATAAHCVEELEAFNVYLDNTKPIKLKELWFAKGENHNDYDIAVIVADEDMDVPGFKLDDAAVLDSVLVMGYPPIPTLNTVQTAETASVGAYIKGQKSSVGEVVAETGSYLAKLDHFIINARVKGGNSGGPVINQCGKVIGTVVRLPFDNQGGSDSGRFDIMGYGICLPSKYLTQLLENPEKVSLVECKGKYCRTDK